MKKPKIYHVPQSETFTLPWKLLQQIARYYEFPSAVFFLKKMPKGTRREALWKKRSELKQKLTELIDSYL